MASVAEITRMTTEELLALPEDGIERWLISGELREGAMTLRNRFHSEVVVSVGYFLKRWNLTQPHPRGRVVGGEAGFRLSRRPDNTVGTDVAYVSAEVMASQSEATTLIDGAPLLAVEILSPSDTQHDIHEKIAMYLSSGVKLVWIIDPDFLTLTVYEKGSEPVMFNRNDEVSADPHLPGFRLPVGELLE